MDVQMLAPWQKSQRSGNGGIGGQGGNCVEVAPAAVRYWYW